MNDKRFEAYFRKRLKEEQETLGNLPIEIIKDTFKKEYEFKKNRPTLNLKMEPQELDYETVNLYLPKKWEMPRNGKLLYNDEELLNVLKLLVFNLGVKKSLDSIPINLIEQYVHKNNRKKEELP